MINLYQADWNRNVGDSISLPIIKHIFNNKIDIKKVHHTTKNKLVAIGSTISWSVKSGDVVWGSGLIQDCGYELPANVKILALRGKLTREKLRVKCDTLGDPAIILPLVYNPRIDTQHDIGIIEHYVDKNTYTGYGLRISVQQHWMSFVDQIKSCKKILSSSLHGLILSEAYGIECQRLKLSNKIIGGDYKFIDYLSASNRSSFSETYDIKKYQDNLIMSIKNYYNV